MTQALNRRQLLMAGGAAWLSAGAVGKAFARPVGPTKKILFFTKSSGFQHGPITRKNGQLGLAERILTEIGKEHGFEVVASKDGRLFNPDKISQWDGFVFYTTGDLTTPGGDKNPPMTAEGERALYDALAGGKGFIGMHSAADTFGHFGARNQGGADPYIRMIGGEFIVHGAQQAARMDIVDGAFPGLKDGFGSQGDSFTINDEWYALKHFQDNLHVILVQNTEGMKGKMYERPSYPATWARPYEKGRVFYTSMGHREDVWENPLYQGLLLGALAWTTGKVDADISPNLRQVTPKADILPT